MKKKLAIFDLDGTLLNTLYDLTESTNFALESLGFSKKTEEQIKNYVGNGVYKLIERAIPDGKDNPKFDDCVGIFKQNYEKNMYNNLTVYDGIIDLLQWLKNSGIKIAVVSNKFDLAVKDLCKKIFSDLVDVSIGENESCGIKKKPSSDMVYSVINQYKFSFEECIFIGDSEVDIETAKNSGIDCISVAWGFKSIEFLKKHGAKTIVNSPEEIKKYL